MLVPKWRGRRHAAASRSLHPAPPPAHAHRPRLRRSPPTTSPRLPAPTTTQVRYTYGDLFRSFDACQLIVLQANAAKTGVNPNAARLLYQGRQLDECRTLASYNIANGDRLHAVPRLRGAGNDAGPSGTEPKPMDMSTDTGAGFQLLIVNFAGITITLDGVAATDTIDAVAGAFATKLDLPKWCVRLLFEGSQLDAEYTLAYYQIAAGSKLHALPRLRGGMPSDGAGPSGTVPEPMEVVGDADYTLAVHWEGTYLSWLPDGLLTKITGPSQLQWALAKAHFRFVPPRPPQSNVQEGEGPTDPGDRFEALVPYNHKVRYEQRYFEPERSRGLQTTKQIVSGRSLRNHVARRRQLRHVRVHDMPANGTPERKAWLKKLQKRSTRITPDMCNYMAPFSRVTFASLASGLPGSGKRPSAKACKKIVTKKANAKRSRMRKLSAYLNDVAQLTNARLGFETSCFLLWFSDILLSAYGMQARFFLFPKYYPDWELTETSVTEIYAYIRTRRSGPKTYDWEDRSTWPSCAVRWERLGCSYELPQQRYLGFTPGSPEAGRLQGTCYRPKVRALYFATRRARTTDFLDGRHGYDAVRHALANWGKSLHDRHAPEARKARERLGIERRP